MTLSSPLKPDERERERLADLINTMMEQKPWKDKLWARAALAMAARAVRRGRLLTEAERFDNLMKALADDEQP